MRRLVHLSDLHFGRSQKEVTEAVLREVSELKPDLVIISGDLTQRARSLEFVEAAKFVGQLPGRVLVVPGNHDIPLYHLPLRLFQPLRGYKRYIEGAREPTYEDSEMIVAGINTVTRWRWKEGRLRGRQLRHLDTVFSKGSADHVRLVFMHHPPMGHLQDVTTSFANRPDLVLSGHLHLSGAVIHQSGAILVAAGTAVSTRTRQDHANSFNVIDVNATPGRAEVRINVVAWNGTKFDQLREQTFERVDRCWRESPTEPSL
jgi:3',5'-cyclic AMP phosphodiesterase CpdA